MIKLVLTDDELVDIAEAMDSPEVSEHGNKKSLAITMHQQGAQHSFIGNMLRISPSTLISYLREYEE